MSPIPSLAGLRCFAPATTAIDRMWSANVWSGDDWRPTGIAWSTNTGPLQLVNGSGLLGVQKPGRVAVPNPEYNAPRNPYTAATEKIVADLAFVLGLPIPPVTLWDRGAALAAERYVAISAWAFQQPINWRDAESTLNAAQRSALIPVASAMVPFEFWIGATDRQNAENVLISADSLPRIRGAWIDYAYALDYAWSRNGEGGCAVVPIFPALGPPDVETMRAVTGAIAELGDAIIERIVSRIPSTYLPNGIAQRIIRTLVSRRALVGALSC